MARRSNLANPLLRAAPQAPVIRASALALDGHRADARGDRTRCVTSSKNRRESGLSRGCQAPAAPLFTAARRTAGGSDVGAVDAPQLFVDLANVDVRSDKPVQNLVECAVAGPRVEPMIGRLPRPELAGEVSPRAARSQNEQDRVDHLARVLPRPPRLGRLREHVGDKVPSVVTQSITNHPHTLHGLGKPTIHSLCACIAILKYQFSDRT